MSATEQPAEEAAGGLANRCRVPGLAALDDADCRNGPVVGLVEPAGQRVGELLPVADDSRSRPDRIRDIRGEDAIAPLRGYEGRAPGILGCHDRPPAGKGRAGQQR